MLTRVRFISVVLLLGLFFPAAWGQTTKVRGRVTDADTGEALPFVSVYFDGTTIGISTDLDGAYYLETRSADAQLLTAHILGYEPQTFVIVNGSFSVVNFRLSKDRNQLEAALVRPDDRYIRSILDRLDRARSRHDPQEAPQWQAGLYSKMEVDVTRADAILENTFLGRPLGFLLDYQDTSAVTGQSFLPVMLSETFSRMVHSLDPKADKEVMLASRISGLDQDNVLRQFTGSYLLSADFYQDRIQVFDIDIPSPASAAGHPFYNYYLVDSLQVDGRKTYTLRFHPKRLVTSPAFDGEMNIDAGDFAIRSVHVNLAPQSNVNWIRHINVDIENRRLPDGTWFYGEERLFIDFSLFLSDRSRLVSFLGHRHLVWSEPDRETPPEAGVLSEGDRVLLPQDGDRDESFWAEKRPYTLTEREQGIFDMADQIRQSRPFRWVYGIANMMITGYLESPRLGIGYGQWARTLTFNGTEGVRVQAGLRTTKEFSQKVRLGGSLAYGFQDEEFKGRAFAEFMFNRRKTRKLTLYVRKDFEQLGRGVGIFSEQNIFNSLLAPGSSDRQSMMKEAKVQYEHEFSPSFNTSLTLRSFRIYGNERVPLALSDGTFQESIAANQIHWSGRFSWEERVNRGWFDKTPIFTRYPIVTVDLMAGIKGITPDDCSFFRSELTFDWKMPTGAAGSGIIHLNGGAVFGAVPYPLLKLHEGNRTRFLDRSAFSCMDYFEYASDRWVTGFYEHNFNGFFLGKIPLVGRLDLREVCTVRAAWGTLTEPNRNGPVRLLEGTSTLEKPYVEAGIGLSNIFRLFRVDLFWRVTHRTPDSRPVVNLALDLDF